MDKGLASSNGHTRDQPQERSEMGVPPPLPQGGEKSMFTDEGEDGRPNQESNRARDPESREGGGSR